MRLVVLADVALEVGEGNTERLKSWIQDLKAGITQCQQIFNITTHCEGNNLTEVSAARF